MAGTWVREAQKLDTTGVHAALLPSGDVLFFSYDPAEENNINRCKWQLWREGVGPLSPLAFVHPRNLFCAGHCWLGDGRIFFAGGQSNNWVAQFWGADHDTHTFSPATSTWTQHGNMPGARYYPTCVTLGDGRAFIVSGAWKRVPQNYVNHEAEIFDGRTNTLSTPMPFNPGFITELYPFLQLLPSSSPEGLLWVHANQTARLFSIEQRQWLAGSFTTTAGGNRCYPKQGTAVMLPLRPEENYRVRILLVGGGSATSAATANAQVFEYDRNNPGASRYRSPAGGDQVHARFMSDAVLLADGSVLVVAGAGEGVADHSTGAVLECERFDPRTETFSADAPINNPRMYHASALLLPSGRVVLGGHTQHWNPGHEYEDPTVEVYTPDYIRAVRPALDSAPAAVAYGEPVRLGSADAASVVTVAFVRCSTVTHSNNMDQRWVGLRIDKRDASSVTVTIPQDRALVPPGHWMFFLLDGNGVPSVARITHLDPRRVPNNRSVAADRWITVRESDAEVDTGIDVAAGDDLELQAHGEIWAGVALTGNNGPEGWANVDYDPKFPLHSGSQAHPFSLIGRIGNGGWFFVGESFGPTRIRTNTGRLRLRVNDDHPGNGRGEFACRVIVRSGRAVIEDFAAAGWFYFFAPSVAFKLVSPGRPRERVNLDVRRDGDQRWQTVITEDPYGGVGVVNGTWSGLSVQANTRVLGFWLGRTTNGTFRGRDGLYHFRLSVFDAGGQIADVAEDSAAINWPQMRVTCINKTRRNSADERIAAVGGDGWRYPLEQMIETVEAGTVVYVEEPTGDRVRVVVAVSARGNKYLKTESDGDEPNNLLSLPECPR